MKNRFLLLISLLCTAVFLSACGADAPAADSDTAGTAAPAIPLTLIGEGAPAYTIIRADNAAKEETDAAVLVRRYMEKCGLRAQISTDWEKNPVLEYEIVIGNTSRPTIDPGMTLSPYDMGEEGFFVQVSGSRIYIAGGSPAATGKAAEHFLREFFGYTGEDTAPIPTTVTIPGDYAYTEKQQFAVTSVRVDGRDLREFRIAWDDSVDDRTARPWAASVQELLYRNYGIRPVIDEGNNLDAPALLLSPTEKGEALLRVSVQNGDLLLSGMPEHGFTLGVQRFLREYLSDKQGDVVMNSDFSCTIKWESAVLYSEFGAVGDGKTDDIAAIIAAHEFANANGLPVKADEGMTFYIGPSATGATIMTDTDFSGASFIIDDRNVPLNQRSAAVFHVPYSVKTYRLNNLQTVRRGQTNLGITLPEDSLIILNDETTMRYIRKGNMSGTIKTQANSGYMQTEMILADKNGNVDPATPIIWDYDRITLASVIPLEEKTLTIKGGTFTTLVNEKIPESDYFKRGFIITRSNVVLDGVTHYVEGEGPDGSPYYSFLHLNNCADITVQNCVFTPHRTFFYTRSDGVRMSAGTYEITPMRVLNLTLKNCSQTVDINNQKYWGIFASNFCKNITMDGCSFSRFDAHQGVTNATIRNSELGYQGINAIGFGTLRVENSTIHNQTLINLRYDYGSAWDGDVIIKNCTWDPGRGTNLTSAYYAIIGGSNTEDHDFGYACSMPRNITIENLRVDDSKGTASYKGIMLFADMNPKRKSEAYEASVQYPYAVTETVTLSGFSSVKGKDWIVSTNEFMFRNVKIHDTDAQK